MNPNSPPGMELEVISSEIVVPALESMFKAEIDMSIATARKYPRQLSSVKKDMISFATLDQETAEGCFYSLPRGGKTIQGPSVRLAEIAVSCYGNIRAGSRILQCVTDGPNPHVLVQAEAMDLERNITINIEKRRRITKKRSADRIDEDDINLAANAGSAIAFRDAVFKVIPMALIKPVFEQAKKVAIGDATSLSDKRIAWIAKFGKMGISQDRVLARLEKKTIEDVLLDDIGTLIGLFNAIKENEVTLDEAFPIPQKRPELAPAGSTPPPPPPVTPAAPKQQEPAATVKPKTKAPPAPPAVVPPPPAPEPEPEPTPEPEATTNQPQQSDEEAAEAALGLAPETTPEPEPEPEPQVQEPASVTKLRGLMSAAGVSETQVMNFCLAKKIANGDQKTLASLIVMKPDGTIVQEAKITNLIRAWANILPGIKATK